MSKVKPYIINLLLVTGLYFIFITLMNADILNRYHEGIIIMACINIILAASLNLITGFLGELALGHAGFMAIGAYSAALFTKNLNLSELIQLPISIIIGGLIASVFGLIIGIPALRLKGDYLAIITLGFGEIVRVIIEYLDITGGARGLKGIQRLSNFTNVYWITFIVVAILFSLINSRHGRNILSIRENEIASESVGVPVAFYKVYTFVISAFFAGVAGGLYAHYTTVLPPSKFNFIFSVEMLVIVVLGGMGSFTGSIVAAILLTLLPEALRSLEIYRMLIYSILLIIMMIFRPSGIFGTKELLITKIINYFKIRKNKKSKIA